MEHARPRHLEFLSLEMSAKEEVMAARRVRGFQTSAQHSAILVHNLVSQSVEFTQFPLISHFRAETLSCLPFSFEEEQTLELRLQ